MRTVHVMHTLIKAIDAELRYMAGQILRSLCRIALLLLLQFFRRFRNGRLLPVMQCDSKNMPPPPHFWHHILSKCLSIFYFFSLAHSAENLQ